MGLSTGKSDPVRDRFHFTAAYKALQKANIEMGIHYVEEIADSLPVTDDIRIKARSIMGTEIPLVEYTPSKDEKPPLFVLQHQRFAGRGADRPSSA